MEKTYVHLGVLEINWSVRNRTGANPHLEHPNLLKLRSLDSLISNFLSDNRICEQ